MNSLLFHSRKSRSLTLLALLPASVLAAGQKKYTLEGQLMPARSAFVSVTSTDHPYSHNGIIFWDGKFKLKNLLPGSYTVTVYVRRLGEFRQTYAVGPGSVDKKGRMKVTYRINPALASRTFTPADRFTVPIRRINIPKEAYKEYADAQKKVTRKDIPGAVRHLEKAVQIAPQFSPAWNYLGTIAYQQRQFEKAAEYFREAHEQDSQTFEPIVNLGGVLLTLRQFDEALRFNQKAVEMRPRDALANAQLGFSYRVKGETDLAIKHLAEARRLDPGHFSLPQLSLAELYQKRGQYQLAAAELENFLRHRPDYEHAGEVRDAIRKLRTIALNPSPPPAGQR